MCSHADMCHSYAMSICLSLFAILIIYPPGNSKIVKKKVRKVIDINVELHTAPCVYVRGARL